MTRLTNIARERIIQKAMADTFTEPRKVMEAAEDVLAREAYDAVFSEDERKKAAALLPNWLRQETCLNFNVDGKRIELCVTGKGLLVPYRTRHYSGYSCHKELGVIKAGELATKIMDHVVEKEKFRDHQRATRRKLEIMLAGITTLKRLEEAWPEGKAFYAGLTVEQAVSVVRNTMNFAVRIEDINEALGLTGQVAGTKDPKQ